MVDGERNSRTIIMVNIIRKLIQLLMDYHIRLIIEDRSAARSRMGHSGSAFRACSLFRSSCLKILLPLGTIKIVLFDDRFEPPCKRRRTILQRLERLLLTNAEVIQLLSNSETRIFSS